MAGMSHVAVPVHDEDLGGEIAEDFVYVDGRLQIFTGGKDLQRFDQALLFFAGGSEFGVVKNAGVAGRAVVDVFQGHVGVLVV